MAGYDQTSIAKLRQMDVNFIKRHADGFGNIYIKAIAMFLQELENIIHAMNSSESECTLK